MTQDTEPSELLSIGDIAHVSGVPVETVRMWERRYGKPASQRLPSGHRRYSHEQARWLRRVAEAVAHGARASVAVAASHDQLEAMLAAPEPRAPDDVEGWLRLVRGFEGGPIRDRIRAEAGQRSPSSLVTAVLAPLLSAVGRAWADGRLDIRHEHFLSALVGEELRLLRHDASSATPAGPCVVFTTLPGERHGLGVELAAFVAARAGARCVLLGTDTPIDEIVASSREVNADVVAVSVSVAHGGIEADRAITELRSRLPAGVRLVVGGAGTRRPRRSPRGVDCIEDLAQFDAFLRTLQRRDRP